MPERGGGGGRRSGRVRPVSSKAAGAGSYDASVGKPVTWMYWGLFSEGKLKAEAENLSCTKPNLKTKSPFTNVYIMINR